MLLSVNLNSELYLNAALSPSLVKEMSHFFFFFKKLYLFYLKDRGEKGKEWERQRFIMHWFTPQVPPVMGQVEVRM